MARISLPYPSFCRTRTEDSRNFYITQAFLRRESFPRMRSPPERSLRCLSVSAKISLRQRRRVRRRILPGASEQRKRRLIRKRQTRFVLPHSLSFLSPSRLKASSASVAPPPRDGTRREQETRAIARKLGTYSTGVARFCLSLRARSPMSMIRMTIQSASFRLARGGSLSSHNQRTNPMIAVIRDREMDPVFHLPSLGNKSRPLTKLTDYK